MAGGALREMVALFSFGVDTSALKEGESQLSGFFNSIKKFAGALTGLFAVRAIEDFADANVRAMLEIEHASQRLGISTDAVQQYQFAAKSLGLETESLLNMMGRLQVSQQAAAQGGKAQAKAFSDLGVKLKDTNGHFKDADTLFSDVAEGIAKIKDPSKQAAEVTALFGRQGRALLPLLKQGKAGLAEFREELAQLGGGYSKKAIEASKEYTHQTARLDAASKSLKSTFLVALLPILGKIVNGLTQVVIWFRELTKQSEIVKATLVVLGAAAAYFGVMLAIDFAPVLLIAAAIAALILIVDDLIVLFEGGDSLIGDAIDRIFGKDAHVEKIKELKDAWYGVSGALQRAAEYIKPLYEASKWIAEHHPYTYLAKGVTTAGGALGNTMAETLAAEKAKFSSRLSNADAMIASTARARLEEARGGAPATNSIPIDPLYGRPMAKAKFEESVNSMRGRIESGELPQFAPRQFGPVINPASDFAPRMGARPPAMAGAGGVTVGDVSVTVQPGDDVGKAAGAHVEQAINKALKQNNRAAAATFQRKNPQGD